MPCLPPSPQLPTPRDPRSVWCLETLEDTHIVVHFCRGLDVRGLVFEGWAGEESCHLVLPVQLRAGREAMVSCRSPCLLQSLPFSTVPSSPAPHVT